MTEKRPTLCVVAGPNGSSKTTTTVQLLNNITQRYLNGGHEVPISKVISRYYKSLINAEEAISFVDRAYVYDNSIDNQLPRLLYRTIDGQLFKQYADNIPEWARLLLK